MKSESPRCHGSISQDGNPGFGGSMFLGGAGGRGAEEGDNGYSGGGGGGLKTNGRSNKNFGGPKGTGGEGGKAFTSGTFSLIPCLVKYFHICFHVHQEMSYKNVLFWHKFLLLYIKEICILPYLEVGINPQESRKQHRFLDMLPVNLLF